jgi:hypothetical protein
MSLNRTIRIALLLLMVIETTFCGGGEKPGIF